MAFRLMVAIYGLVAISLICVSFVTTRRAKQLSGDDHYLFTQTRILYDKYVPPNNATDAALDEASEDRMGFMTVDEPLFVLGFLDVTGPFIVGGGLALLIAKLIIRGRQKRGLLRAKEV